jgi:hypothetical protein
MREGHTESLSAAGAKARTNMPGDPSAGSSAANERGNLVLDVE